MYRSLIHCFSFCFLTPSEKLKNRNLAFATCKTKLLPTAAVALEGLRLYCTALPVSSGAQMPRYFRRMETSQAVAKPIQPPNV